jgi:hypothetical protein
MTAITPQTDHQDTDTTRVLRERFSFGTVITLVSDPSQVGKVVQVRNVHKRDDKDSYTLITVHFDDGSEACLRTEEVALFGAVAPEDMTAITTDAQATAGACQHPTALNTYGLPAETCGAPTVEHRPDRLLVRNVCVDHR